MKHSGFYSLLTFLIGFLWILVTTGCETGRAGCEGKIVVENPIPDTTLYLDGETYRRDVFANPPVFVQTENQSMRILVSSMTSSIVIATREINDKTGKASIVQVEPLTTGEDKVIVRAMDACPDYEVNTSFNVAVLDTTN